MNKKGILFVISGPSGVGKGSIVERLLPSIPEILVSVSATTRPAREGETQGKDYYFVTVDDFRELIQNDQLLEWAEVYGNYYGTPRDFVMKNLAAGQDVLLEIDIQGAMQVKEKVPEGVFIFIAPPGLDALAARLQARGKDSRESINRRLAACREEMKQAGKYDYMVINDQLDRAVNFVRSIINAEHCRIRNLDLGCDI